MFEKPKNVEAELNFINPSAEERALREIVGDSLKGMSERWKKRSKRLTKVLIVATILTVGNGVASSAEAGTSPDSGAKENLKIEQVDGDGEGDGENDGEKEKSDLEINWDAYNKIRQGIGDFDENKSEISGESIFSSEYSNLGFGEHQGESFNETDGDLEKSGGGIVVRNIVASETAMMEKSESKPYLFDNYCSSLQIETLRDGVELEPAGSVVTIGEGATESEAIAEALKDAGAYAGIEISSDKSFTDASETYNDDFKSASESSSLITTNSETPIYEYEVTNVEQDEDGYYNVKIDVQLGKVVEK